MIDSSLKHSVARVSLDRGCLSRITAPSWSYDTHGCTHAFTTGYTTVDAMLEIGTASATVE